VSFRTKILGRGGKNRCLMIQCKVLRAGSLCNVLRVTEEDISGPGGESGVLQERELLNWELEKKKKKWRKFISNTRSGRH